MGRTKRHGPRGPERESAPVADIEAVRGVLGPIAADRGSFLEDVTIRRAGGKNLVRVIVDLPEDERGSMSLDHVAEVSQLISKALDADDVIAGSYTLEVSTPGTSRPLVEVRHFKRARGRLVRLVLAGGGSATGRLVEADGRSVTVLNEESGARSEFALDGIVRGHVEVELTRVAQADFEESQQEA